MSRAERIYVPDTRTPEQYQEDLAKLQSDEEVRKALRRDAIETIADFAAKVTPQRGLSETIGNIVVKTTPLQG